MMSRTDEERLKRYRQSIGVAWGFGDYNEWPIKLNAAFHLFLKEFGDDVIKDLTCLEEEKGFSLKQIAELFYNPARVYRIIDSVIYSMRKKRCPLSYQRNMVIKLLNMVKALKYGSEFNEKGGNIIYDPKKVDEIVNTKLGKGTSRLEESKLIHQFCGVMWGYTESIFFRAHDVTKEIHGPYYYNQSNRHFVVKEYLNLRPMVLWPDVTLLPCNEIKIYKGYTDAIKIRVDALNHLYHEGGQLVPSLESYYIEVDGKKEPVEILKEFLEIVEQTITQISTLLDHMNWNEKVLKYAEIFWFRKKPLREARELDWQVPEALRKNILAGKENPIRQKRLTDEQSHRLAMLTI
ncbi:MAG: hypothetical protein PVH61_01195 [Candidatus Aminicenantes bacterium]|jgi:hypothetical protein